MMQSLSCLHYLIVQLTWNKLVQLLGHLISIYLHTTVLLENGVCLAESDLSLHNCQIALSLPYHKCMESGRVCVQEKKMLGL